MKHTHFSKGLTVLLCAALLTTSLPAFAADSRLGGGNLEAFEAHQKELAETQQAQQAAELEAQQAEDALLKAILQSVQSGEELTQAQQEKHEAYLKLEEEKKKAEAAKKAQEEKKQLVDAYDESQDKDAYYQGLDQAQKLVLDQALDSREAYLKNEANKKSAIVKIEAEGYVYSEMNAPQLRKALDEIQALTEDELKIMEIEYQKLVKAEELAAEKEKQAAEEEKKAQELYEETLKLLKEAEDQLFGLKVEDHIKCNGETHNLRRVICKFQQTDEDFALEAKETFAPEECFYYGTQEEPNESYDRCMEKHVKIHACWSEPEEKRNQCVQSNLGLPETLVPIESYCEGKTQDCKDRYQAAIYDLVGYKFLVVAGQVEEWYFSGELPIDVAASRVEQIMQKSKAFYWTSDVEEKKQYLSDLQLIWDATKDSLIQEIVQELKEEDGKILETARKKLGEGKELTQEEQAIYDQDRLTRKALSVELYQANLDAGKDPYDGLTEGQKTLVEEAIAEQEAEQKAEADSKESQENNTPQ